MNSVTVPKNVKGGPFGIFDIHCVAKYRNKRREDPLVESKKLQKSLIVPKNQSEKHQRGILCFRGSGVLSMFCSSVVQVEDAEQTNKKVDRLR